MKSLKVNGIAVSDFKEDSKNLLKGEAGSTVEVSYLRQKKTLYGIY